MKSVLFFFFVLLAVTCFGADGTGPEPAPWWMRVEEFQSLALRWLTCISIVGAAVVATGLAIWAKVSSGLKEIRARQDRASVEKQALQCQVATLAANMPPPPAPIVLAPPPAGIDSRPAGE